jgi:hypothetical protein
MCLCGCLFEIVSLNVSVSEDVLPSAACKILEVEVLAAIGCPLCRGHDRAGGVILEEEEGPWGNVVGGVFDYPAVSTSRQTPSDLSPTH